ncbi:MAG: hypothetical protein IJ364_06640, partial [Oscillospiraceae bacterium]|nr:hypothetical protein [Oscillospiraceae bacterium]
VTGGENFQVDVAEDGSFTIPKEKLVGNAFISASGVEKSYNISYIYKLGADEISGSGSTPDTSTAPHR